VVGNLHCVAFAFQSLLLFASRVILPACRNLVCFYVKGSKFISSLLIIVVIILLQIQMSSNKRRRRLYFAQEVKEEHYLQEDSARSLAETEQLCQTVRDETGRFRR